MALLELNNISAGYGKNIILNNFNLKVEKGQLVSLLGPSGCGKTTTLRLIAGFVEANKGKFMFDSHDYTGVPTHKRNFGFVFQNYALFPHLNVFDNIAFGLKLRNISTKEIKNRVQKMLEIVDLKGFGDRYPANLSGGQQQRVALARALVIKPGLLLLDEPLSNLDAKLRVKMRIEIRKIQQELGITTVYVTHDQEECFSISDKVAITNQGDIEQLDTPPTIYNHPTTEFVAKFVGFEKFFKLNFVADDGNKTTYKTKNDIKFSVLSSSKINKDKSVKGTIRPDNIILQKGGLDYNQNILPGEVEIRTFLGGKYQYVVNTELGNFIINDDSQNLFQIDDKVQLYFPEDKIITVK